MGSILTASWTCRPVLLGGLTALTLLLTLLLSPSCSLHGFSLQWWVNGRPRATGHKASCSQSVCSGFQDALKQREAISCWGLASVHVSLRGFLPWKRWVRVYSWRTVICLLLTSSWFNQHFLSLEMLCLLPHLNAWWEVNCLFKAENFKEWIVTSEVLNTPEETNLLRMAWPQGPAHKSWRRGLALAHTHTLTHTNPPYTRSPPYSQTLIHSHAHKSRQQRLLSLPVMGFPLIP